MPSATSIREHSGFVLRLLALAVVYAAVALFGSGPGASGPAMLLAGTMLAGGLIWLSVVDLVEFRLPNWLTLSLAFAGMASQSGFEAAAFAEHGAAAAVGFIALCAVAWSFERCRGYAGLGLGDAKLFGVGGAWDGLDGLAPVLLVASVLALAGVAFAYLAGTRIDRRTRLPFGPFLGVAIWLVWLLGPAMPY